MTRQPRKAPRHAEAERNDRVLLKAAQEVLAVEGRHASVAAIATRAGVGIGSLYRRYRTKEELFQRLCVVALEQWIQAAEAGLRANDPWEGLGHLVKACVESHAGALAPVAGTIVVSEAMQAAYNRSDDLTAELVTRAQAAGVMREDVTARDVMALIVQLSRRDQFDESEADRNARERVVAIALDGLRPGRHTALPGQPPGDDLFTEHWSPPED